MASPLEEASKAAVVGRKRKQPAQLWDVHDRPSNYGDKRQRVEDYKDYLPTDSHGETSDEASVGSNTHVSLHSSGGDTESSESDDEESGEVSSSLVSSDEYSRQETHSEVSCKAGQRNEVGRSAEVWQAYGAESKVSHARVEQKHSPVRARRRRSSAGRENGSASDRDRSPVPVEDPETKDSVSESDHAFTRNGKRCRGPTPDGDEQSKAPQSSKRSAVVHTEPIRAGIRKLSDITHTGLRGHITFLALSQPTKSIEALVEENCASNMTMRKHALDQACIWDGETVKSKKRNRRKKVITVKADDPGVGKAPDVIDIPLQSGKSSHRIRCRYSECRC